MNMRLGYITEWFPPEPEGAPLWIAQAMRDRGFDVGVVTGIPHYPTGKPATGYTWHTRRRETVEGFPVLRLPEFPSHDRSAIRRIGTFGSFSASSALWGSRAIAGADVCLVYSSPATAALGAMVARRRFGVPYVLMIQDLWPDSMLSSGFISSGPVNRALASVAHSFVDATYQHASHIAVISPGMRSALLKRGVPDDKISVIYNWVDEAVLTPTPSEGELRRLAGLSEDDFILLFAGNQGEAQGLDAWVSALARLSGQSDTHLVLLGDGTQRAALREQAARMDVSDRVHFLSSVPIGEIPRLTADADFSVVSLKDDPLFRMTLPSKLQAALAQAKPVICSVPGDGATLVESAGAGWVATPDNPLSISKAIRQATVAGSAEIMARGRAGRRYYEEHMSRQVGSARLAEILERVARGGRSERLASPRD